MSRSVRVHRGGDRRSASRRARTDLRLVELEPVDARPEMQQRAAAGAPRIAADDEEESNGDGRNDNPRHGSRSAAIDSLHRRTDTGLCDGRGDGVNPSPVSGGLRPDACPFLLTTGEQSVLTGRFRRPPLPSAHSRLDVAMRTVLMAAMAVCGLAAAARAQSPHEILVRVRVVDTSRAPIAGAEVSVVRDLNTQLASGVTDALGLRDLRVPRSEGEYQIVVRRIGYQRSERFFARPLSDTVAVQIDLRRAAQELAPVKVTEQEDRTRRHYHLDADEIANSDRLLYDGPTCCRRSVPK